MSALFQVADAYAMSSLQSAQVAQRKTAILDLIALHGPLSAAAINRHLPGAVTNTKKEVTSNALAELMKELPYDRRKKVWGASAGA
ncbi:hypothetical protein LEM8419_03495 [Neolewinella maritima]|uniref:Uncharacterized protein n=1 Tax=Neolewinella maritima TaxID=1383882 RepID=A0ABM9B5K8_9BACT|nr:hypothetical protein [Neolewinella maritima]CAH1002623.1 hypothetical protein LEM8419_03495 [Neolewinella maritima]